MIDEKKLITELEKLKQEVNMPVDIVWNNLLKVCIDTVNRQPKVGEWIPCSERLPKPYELVLIQNVYGVVSVASRTGERWFNFQGTELWQAIAWMSLPEPYKEEVTE